MAAQLPKGLELLARWALPLGVAASAAQYSMYNGTLALSFALYVADHRDSGGRSPGRVI